MMILHVACVPVTLNHPARETRRPLPRECLGRIIKIMISEPGFTELVLWKVIKQPCPHSTAPKAGNLALCVISLPAEKTASY